MAKLAFPAGSSAPRWGAPFALALTVALLAAACSQTGETGPRSTGPLTPTQVSRSTPETEAARTAAPSPTAIAPALPVEPAREMSATVPPAPPAVPTPAVTEASPALAPSPSALPAGAPPSSPAASTGGATVPVPYRGQKNSFAWDSKAAREAGKNIFSQNCAGCHGANGALQSSANFASAQFRRQLEEQPDYFLWRLSEGKTAARGFNMPAFKAVLGEGERWQVLTYLHSLADQQMQTQ